MFFFVSVLLAGAWSAAANDHDQWIQVDLLTTQRLATVITQGRASTLDHQWVTSYNVSYSQNGADWTYIAMLYSGNIDSYTKKANSLPDDTKARFIRLRPNSWHRHIAMRWDVSSCSGPSKLSLLYTCDSLL